MLQYEEDVEENGEKPETELGYIAKNALPIIVVVGLRN